MKNQNTSTYNKWKSRRWLIVVWAMISFTISALGSIIMKWEPSWMSSSMPIFLGIIITYIGAESYTKTKFKQFDSTTNSSSEEK